MLMNKGKLAIIASFYVFLPYISFHDSLFTIFLLADDKDSRTWPRAAAVAERLWSNPSTPAHLASDRLYRHNQRLRLLGIQPEPLSPKYCVLAESQCL